MNKNILSDSKSLGNYLNLFFFNDVALGQAFFLPKGVILFENIKSLLRKQLHEHNFCEVYTPSFATKSLWDLSGHSNKFIDNMFNISDEYYLKPMNCPMHLLIMKRMLQQNINFPIKLFEFNECFRHEKKGALNGLFRLSKFRQDDCHILCHVNDLKQILKDFFNMVIKVYKYFGFYDIKFYLATTESLLKENDILYNLGKAILSNNLTLKERDGAFYGPKIDIHLTDSLNREWQCGTIQLDYYTHHKIIGKLDEDIVLVHHAVLGTLERFISIALENNKGFLPFSINPTKFSILIMKDVLNNQGINEYVNKICNILDKFCVKGEIELNWSYKDINDKVKKAIMKRSFFTFCIGQNELDNEFVTLRLCNEGKLHNVYINVLESFIKNYIYQ